MITWIERNIRICAALTLAVMAGCSHSTATNNEPASGSGLPTVGSIFTYVDSALNPLNGQFVVINESDTVFQSGVTILGVPNTVLLSPNTRTFLIYLRDVTVSISGGGVTETLYSDDDGPPVFSLTSSGNLMIPTTSNTQIVSDSLGHVMSDDSTVSWFLYPIHTDSTITEPSIIDSITWSDPSSFVVQNRPLNCEHAIMHVAYSTKIDLYFSASLGVPVTMVVNNRNANGTFQPVASKHLISYELK